MPLRAMLLAAFILKEPITGKKVLGIACGAGGALLLILGSSQNQPAASSASHTAIWGDLLVLFAQFCYAFYIVRFKDFVNKYSLITIMKWMFTYLFHLHDSLLCQRFDERRLERTEGGGNWQI